MKILKGKKLYRTGPLKVYIRTGPLKLFNNKWGSEGYSSSTYSISNNSSTGSGGGGSKGGSTSSSSGSSAAIKEIQRKAKEAAAAKAAAAQAAKEREARQKAAREKYKREQKEAQARDVAAINRVKQQQAQAEKDRQKRKQQSDVDSINRTNKQQQEAQVQADIDEAERVETETSGFGKQLEGVDIDEAIASTDKRRLAKIQKQHSQKSDVRNILRRKKQQEDAEKERKKEADRVKKETSGFGKQLQDVDIDDAQDFTNKLRDKRGEKKERDKRDAADDRNFLEKMSDFLYTGSTSLDRKDAQEKRQAYNDARRKHAINEARRLGRPVVVDGKYYTPEMETREEFDRRKNKKKEEEERVKEETSGFGKQIEESKKEEAAQKRAKEADIERRKQEEIALSEGWGSLAEKEAMEPGGAWEQRKANLQKAKADIDFERGKITEREYVDITGQNPDIDSPQLRHIPKGLGVVTDYLLKGGGKGVEEISEFAQKRIAPAATEDDAMERLSEQESVTVEDSDKLPEAPRVEDVTDPSARPFLPQKGGNQSAPVVAARTSAAATPAAAAATKKEDEQSLADKEAKIVRERALAQQLAAIRGARGLSAGQKMIALKRAQEAFDRDIGSQLLLARAREKMSKEEKALAHQRDLERLRLESEIKYGKGSSGGGASTNPWITGINTVRAALPLVKYFSKDGGAIDGPGSETSDSIPARLSDGEFVVKSSAVRGLGKAMGAKGKDAERKKGVDFLYKLQDKMDRVEKFSEGGEAYARPKKAFREAIGYEPESRFHDKALKDAKHGGARRRFRHYQEGGEVDYFPPSAVYTESTPPPPRGFGAVVSAQGDLQRRLEELEKQMGR